jgi:hypothetical protein
LITKERRACCFDICIPRRLLFINSAQKQSTSRRRLSYCLPFTPATLCFKNPYKHSLHHNAFDSPVVQEVDEQRSNESLPNTCLSSLLLNPRPTHYSIQEFGYIERKIDIWRCQRRLSRRSKTRCAAYDVAVVLLLKRWQLPPRTADKPEAQSDIQQGVSVYSMPCHAIQRKM